MKNFWLREKYFSFYKIFFGFLFFGKNGVRRDYYKMIQSDQGPFAKNTFVSSN